MAVKRCSIDAGFPYPLANINSVFDGALCGMLDKNDLSKRGRNFKEETVGQKKMLELFRAARKALGSNAGFREVVFGTFQRGNSSATGQDCVGGYDGIEKKKENPAAMKSEWNVRIEIWCSPPVFLT